MVLMIDDVERKRESVCVCVHQTYNNEDSNIW